MLLAGFFLFAELFLPLPAFKDVFLSPLAGSLPNAKPLQQTIHFATTLWPVLMIGPLMQSKSRTLASLQGQNLLDGIFAPPDSLFSRSRGG